MREKLSKGAQKCYRTNPEAYLELKEIEQRGTRIVQVVKRRNQPAGMPRVRTHSENLTLEGYLEMDPWGDPSVDARRGFLILFFGNIPLTNLKLPGFVGNSITPLCDHLKLVSIQPCIRSNAGNASFQTELSCPD